MFRQPRRTLEHWTPELGNPDAWLASQRAAGWTPEYEQPWIPEPVVVNGRQVWPVALINQGLVDSQSGQDH